MERISVIIPVYNAEKFLRECLDSVINQTYKNVEIVAVNDGSKDGSLEILNEYSKKYPNVKVVDRENGGVCSARNVGLDNASGDYIAFLDSDDYLLYNALQTLYGDLTNNNADISCSLLTSDLTQKLDGNVSVWEDEEPIVNCLLDNQFTYSSCGKLFKKEVLDGVRFEVGRKIHEDSYFVFCCFKKSPKVTTRNEFLYYYRENVNSASHAKFSEKYFDILYFASEKFNAVEKDFPHLISLAKNVLVKANISMLQVFLNVKGKKYKKDIKACIKVVKRNKKYFIPSYNGDKKRFSIIKNNQYGLYKILYQFKYKDRVTKF